MKKMDPFIRKGTEPAMVLSTLNFHTDTEGEGAGSGELPVLTFPILNGIPGIRHCFTTREGGVSSGYFSSLNLKNGIGDRDENVAENFRRVADGLGISPDDFVLTDQTHTANVRVVTEADRGRGVTKKRDYRDVDGLVTNVPGLVLAVFSADCVPVFFVDPKRRAVGLAHSGWKGTVQRIGAETIRLMSRQYGTDPADLICAVGPSICRDCYEVSEDVAEQFRDAFPGHEAELLTGGRAGHYQLDLWAANRIVLTEAGVLPEHIGMTDLCTCCNPKRLFSHRASGGRRGVMGSFLGLTGSEGAMNDEYE
ncbi:MAG: peptidoglycan editing factor PgeF [Lachnospiraceae bacterium]|jgi:YfiH family protein|nr:peptidoglycan editing factor PgeF [Lachnospiraceae bacterium]MCI1328852.1 peptidoglycan editing factor PgeF [Lachnospiraceae bacterium]